jgi:uncharacterized membrane protein YhiD involved in acid resistance
VIKREEGAFVENAQGHDDPRTALVSKLTYLHGWLRFVNERWQQKATIAQRYQTLMPFKKKWGIPFIMLGFVGVTLALFTVAAPVTDLLYKIALEPLIAEEWAAANTGVAIILMLAVPIVVSAGLVILVVYLRNRFLLSRQHARAEGINQQREAHNQAVWAEEKQVNAQLKQAGQDFSTQIGNWYPQAYLYEDALVFCTQVIQNHRATDIEGALNLYETELHRQRVENNQAALMAEQQRTQKLMIVGNVMNAALTGAAIGTIRQQGQQTRAANAANAARITDQLRKPVDVNIRKRR